jgi:hypothetical protein
MAALFASGRIVDAILVLVVLETGVLLLCRRTDLLATLLAGLALMAAVRLAIAGADWRWLALALLAALVAHAFDLARRWRPAAAQGARKSGIVSGPSQ